MLAFAVEESAVKDFMNRLLREGLLDDYEIHGAEINTFTRIDISCEADLSDPRRFCLWRDIRPLVRAVVQTGPRPRSLKIVFSCPPALCAAIDPNASALSLNLHYENGELRFTTATTQKQFVLDKTLAAKWDAHIAAYFKELGVPVKVL